MKRGVTKYQPKPCLCGCGEEVKVHKYPKKGGGSAYLVNKFIKKHARRGAGGFNPQIHTSQLCHCGCEQWTSLRRGRCNKFIKGHENIRRIPWNKGKPFSVETRQRMRSARLGKEPANKVTVDLKVLHKLYVVEKKTASIVCRELKVSLDVIKNRLRDTGWSRSTQ